MFLTYLKCSQTYWIIYKNTQTGKRNRKNTNTNDKEKAENILKIFEEEYSAKQTSNNLLLIEEIQKIGYNLSHLKSFIEKEYLVKNDNRNIHYEINFVFDNLFHVFSENKLIEEMVPDK